MVAALHSPDPGVWLFPFGINDRGQIVGVYESPGAAPSPQPAAMRLRGTA
jgi:hypothetical protein